MVQDPVKGTPKTVASLCNQINSVYYRKSLLSSAEQPQSGEEDI